MAGLDMASIMNTSGTPELHHSVRMCTSYLTQTISSRVCSISSTHDLFMDHKIYS